MKLFSIFLASVHYAFAANVAELAPSDPVFPESEIRQVALGTYHIWVTAPYGPEVMDPFMGFPMPSNMDAVWFRYTWPGSLWTQLPVTKNISVQRMAAGNMSLWIADSYSDYSNPELLCRSGIEEPYSAGEAFVPVPLPPGHTLMTMAVNEADNRLYIQTNEDLDHVWWRTGISDSNPSGDAWEQSHERVPNLCSWGFSVSFANIYCLNGNVNALNYAGVIQANDDIVWSGVSEAQCKIRMAVASCDGHIVGRAGDGTLTQCSVPITGAGGGIATSVGFVNSLQCNNANEYVAERNGLLMATNGIQPPMPPTTTTTTTRGPPPKVVRTEPLTLKTAAKGANFTGTALENKTGTEVLTCATDCKENLDCNTFAFHRGTGECILFEDVFEEAKVTRPGDYNIWNIIE